MESRLAEASTRERDLESRLEQVEDEKNQIENEFKSHSEESTEKISSLESQLNDTLEKVDGLQLELSHAQQEVGVVKEDARKYSEQAVATQELYERELLQHGKSMESLHRVKDEVRKRLK